jgi:hypothetical protein
MDTAKKKGFYTAQKIEILGFYIMENNLIN